jgi:protein FAM32A
MKKILEKASLTHKEKVLQYNQKLDKLSEHNDIPKVSWTK